jgi:hypothetical protein
VSAQLDLLPICRIPERGSQCYELLMAMQSGERLTVKSALEKHGVYALSQRVGELKRKYGWESVIRSRTVTTAGGARISEYWMDRCGERRA